MRLAVTQGHVRALAHPLQCCTLCPSPALPQVPPCLDPFFLTPRPYYLQCAGSPLSLTCCWLPRLDFQSVLGPALRQPPASLQSRFFPLHTRELRCPEQMGPSMAISSRVDASTLFLSCACLPGDPSASPVCHPHPPASVEAPASAWALTVGHCDLPTCNTRGLRGLFPLGQGELHFPAGLQGCRV